MKLYSDCKMFTDDRYKDDPSGPVGGDCENCYRYTFCNAAASLGLQCDTSENIAKFLNLKGESSNGQRKQSSIGSNKASNIKAFFRH